MSMKVISQAGPLPIQAKLTWPSSEPIVVAVSGSAWTSNPNTMLTVQVAVNGKQIGVLQQYANPASTHLAFPAGFFVTTQQLAPAVISLTAGSGTTTDGNDNFNVTLIF
jgi:hypothetical protein